MREKIDLQTVENFYSAETYEELVEWLVETCNTTGDNKSSQMIEYTKLNYHRSRRIKKNLELREDLVNLMRSIDISLNWLLIAEPWCGDVPHSLPIIAALTDLNRNIRFDIILRDENPEVMDQFLTNGSKSIPKLVCYNPETFDVLWTWGSRPAEVQQIVKAYKENPSPTKASLYEEIQRWYIADKGRSMQRELISKLLLCKEKMAYQNNEEIGV